jgi:hypothetical protein
VDAPVCVALIFHSDLVPIANRLLNLEASQAALTEPKLSVDGPNEALDAHFARG